MAGSTAAERSNFGRRTDGPTGLPASGRVEDDPALLAAFREAGDVADVVRLLADSWEDEAIVRDLESGKFLDRERVHNVAFDGEFFSITGASIVPRSPQGPPLITALAHQTVPYRFAAEHADLVFITPADAAAVSGIRDELDVVVREEPLRVFADLLVLVEQTREKAAAVWSRLQERAPLATDARVVVGTPDDVVDEIAALAAAGVDGIRLRPARLPADLEAIADRVVPRAASAGVLVPDDGAPTLRERLGLPRLASRYARQEVGA